MLSDGEDLIAKLRLTPEAAAVGPAKGAPSEPSKLKREPRAWETEPFIHLPVSALLAGGAVLDSAGEVLTWIYILREWKMRSRGQETIVLSNAGLARWGISRFVKGRAVKKLVEAGLICAQKQGKRSPHVSVVAHQHEHLRNRT